MIAFNIIFYGKSQTEMMASVGEQFDYERRASLKEMPSFRREAAGSLGRMDSIASIKERLEASRELLLSGAADPVQVFKIST